MGQDLQDETEHGQGPDTEEEFQLDGRWHVLPRENRIVGPGVDRRVPDKFMRVLVHLRRRPGVVSRRRSR